MEIFYEKNVQWLEGRYNQKYVVKIGKKWSDIILCYGIYVECIGKPYFLRFKINTILQLAAVKYVNTCLGFSLNNI